MQLASDRLENMRKKPRKDSTHAWIQLHRAHRRLLERVESALKNAGLPPLDWYDVLLELQRTKTTGLRQYEIGEKVLLNKHNLSRLLDRLEMKQLIRRQACLEDGRGNRIEIAADGERMLKQMWPVYSQTILDHFDSKLNSEEFVELSRLLDKLLGQAEPD